MYNPLCIPGALLVDKEAFAEVRSDRQKLLSDTAFTDLPFCAPLCEFWTHSFSLKSVRNRNTRPRKAFCNPVHFFGRNPHPFVLTFGHFGGTLRIHFPPSKSTKKIATFSRNFVNFSHRKILLIFPFLNPSEILLDCATPVHLPHDRHSSTPGKLGAFPGTKDRHLGTLAKTSARHE